VENLAARFLLALGMLDCTVIAGSSMEKTPVTATLPSGGIARGTKISSPENGLKNS